MSFHCIEAGSEGRDKVRADQGEKPVLAEGTREQMQGWGGEGSYLGHSSLQRPRCGSHSSHLPVGEKNQRLHSQVERQDGMKMRRGGWLRERRHRGTGGRSSGDRGTGGQSSVHIEEGNTDEQLGGGLGI